MERSQKNIQYYSRKLLMQFKIYCQKDSTKIINVLKEKERCTVGEIRNIVSISQSLVSQRLGELRTIHFVEDFKNSRNVYYKLNEQNINKFEKLIIDYFQLEDDK